MFILKSSLQTVFALYIMIQTPSKQKLKWRYFQPWPSRDTSNENSAGEQSTSPRHFTDQTYCELFAHFLDPFKSYASTAPSSQDTLGDSLPQGAHIQNTLALHQVCPFPDLWSPPALFRQTLEGYPLNTLSWPTVTP